MCLSSQNSLIGSHLLVTTIYKVLEKQGHMDKLFFGKSRDYLILQIRFFSNANASICIALAIMKEQPSTELFLTSPFLWLNSSSAAWSLQFIKLFLMSRLYS